VWFDALPNYLTATGFPDGAWESRWPAQLHVIGKDITRFHSIIWPAMLEAAGLPLPERVWGHGFVLLGGERFSKSAGVRLDLDEAIGRFGRDAFRYFLLREVPFDADGSFSWERFEDRYNSDLANAWGNLASRVISMVERYCDGIVPAGARTDLDTRDAAELLEYHEAMDGTRGFLLHEALRIVWQSVRARQRVRRPAGALEAGEGSRASNGAGDHARRTRPSACPTRGARRAVHARQGAGALDAARRTTRTGEPALPHPAHARRDRMAGAEGEFALPERKAGRLRRPAFLCARFG
jgi:methionyl-tRNA synthetase